MPYDFYVRCKQDLIDAVENYGIVPYFANSVPGFSLEEHCHPAALWSDTEECSWDWKGPVIRATNCAYGKFFEKKAVYVSREIFCDLANYRRDGYDFDARYEDGLARFEDKELYELLDSRAPVLSKELRSAGDYAWTGSADKRGRGKGGFDAAMTRLQECCYVLISDFVYTTDRYGKKRGWGVAEYNTPEKWLGKSFTEHVYEREPEESYERLLRHLRTLFPAVGEKELRRFLK